MDDSGRALLAMGSDQIEYGRADLQRALDRTRVLSVDELRVAARARARHEGPARCAGCRRGSPSSASSTRGDASDQYDELTVAAVQARSSGRARSSRPAAVGPETLIALYQALDYTTPRLYTAGDDS